ncbi:homocysteine S-methyltransferase [Algoriphagus sp.]|uniref:homocysteine S-methyltransferase n=1 Tax=Algoriphagus sp. TaxID=1872435 RepID=UPI00391ABE0A
MALTYPLLLDGGLSNELERQGCDLNQELWSAKLLESNPEAIIFAHLSYLESGAQCIITSSYQATLPGFMAIGYDKSSASSLILKSVKLAEEARNRFLSVNKPVSKPLIAASIGPYGAYLADGSEYRGDYMITDQELRDFHEPRITLLDNSAADILACETIPNFREAKVLSELLENAKKPAWVSFSCKDGKHISDGTPIEECASFFAHHSTVFAIGVNCTSPEFISELIRSIKTKSGSKKIVVYPNSGATYHAESKTWTNLTNLSSCEMMVKEWMDLGADLIGGCCGIGPLQIKAMSKVISDC